MRIQVILPISSDPEFPAKVFIWLKAAQDLGHIVDIPEPNQAPADFDLERTLARMQSVELIAADLSFERPSCYYELGLAQSLRIPTVIFLNASSTLHQHGSTNKLYRYASLEEYQANVQSLLATSVSPESIIPFGRSVFEFERQKSAE